MHFEGSCTIHAPREKVWAYVSDPRSALEYVPNIKSLTMEGADQFKVTVGVGVGSIKGTFDLEFQMAEMVPFKHTQLQANGSGIKSHVEFATTIDLSDTPDGETVMAWAADAKVGGLIAGVGQRLLGMVGEKMVNDMFTKLREKIEQ